MTEMAILLEINRNRIRCKWAINYVLLMFITGIQQRKSRVLPQQMKPNKSIFIILISAMCIAIVFGRFSFLFSSSSSLFFSFRSSLHRSSFFFICSFIHRRKKKRERLHLNTIFIALSRSIGINLRFFLVVWCRVCWLHICRRYWHCIFD